MSIPVDNIRDRSDSVSSMMPESVTPVQSYSIRAVSLDAVPSEIASEWNESRTTTGCSVPMQDLEWLRGYFGSDSSAILLFCAFSSGRLCGVAPFLTKDWPLRWRLGEFTVANLPLRRLRLLGSAAGIPPDENAYDALFEEIARHSSGIDTLFLEEIPVDSYLWKYLHESSVIRKSFSIYEPEAPSPHLLLRFQGSFEEYLAKFSSKHRKNLNRETKRLRDGVLGPMQFDRFERPEEVDRFLESAVGVSKKTYQWNLHQQGLSATERLRTRLSFAARHGWMRCYLLSCGGNACAFVVGFQYRGRFLLHEIGFDPDLARYSVGTVMQFLAVQDLFAHNTPEVLDLGDYGTYKETLSTESYVQGKVFLFRKGAYGTLIRGGHRCCEWTTRSIASILDRLQLKTRIRQKIRGLNQAK